MNIMHIDLDDVTHSSIMNIMHIDLDDVTH